MLIGGSPLKVAAGQADGIQSRTIEVLQVCLSLDLPSHLQPFHQSYGLAERLLREGNQMHMCVREHVFDHKLCLSDRTQ